MNGLSSRRARLLTVAVTAAATFVACKPWTVRPIDEKTGNAAAPGAFDASAYVESIWTTKVLYEARASAVDLRAALAGTAPGRTPLFVRGDGVVAGVDTRSRVGLALVDLAPGDGRADVAMQIGPVLRGTAVRDALPFIRFGDFDNQLAFADVANALNGRVVSSVLTGLDPTSLEGRRLTFWGATRLDGTAGRFAEIIPVILEWATE